MAVVIRLKRLGTKNRPHQRIVVMDSRKSRNSKTLEELGAYDPTAEPPSKNLNKERASYWLKAGAKPSPTVSSIFRKLGVISGGVPSRQTP